MKQLIIKFQVQENFLGNLYNNRREINIANRYLENFDIAIFNEKLDL